MEELYMSIDCFGPESLERLSLEGAERLARMDFDRSGSERLWALRYVMWDMLLQAAGVPGIWVGDLNIGLWKIEPAGRQLCSDAYVKLRDRGLIETRNGRDLYATDADGGEFLAELWRWLNAESLARG
jgi:hypothetical protein